MMAEREIDDGFGEPYDLGPELSAAPPGWHVAKEEITQTILACASSVEERDSLRKRLDGVRAEREEAEAYAIRLEEAVLALRGEVDPIVRNQIACGALDPMRRPLGMGITSRKLRTQFQAAMNRQR